MEELADTGTKKQNEALIEKLKILRSKASAKQPSSALKKREKYYSGSYTKEDDTQSNLQNNRNIIKPVINTKATFALDQQVTTKVEPRTLSFQSIKDAEVVYDIADILDDCLANVKKTNCFPKLKKRFMKRGLKAGIAIAKIVWDASKNAIGDVDISEIPPSNFFPDPSCGSDIQSANYVFVKVKKSVYTLKSQYPHLMSEIDNISKVASQESENDESGNTPLGTTTFQNDSATSQKYVYGNGGTMSSIQSDVELWEAYLKDDTVFVPEGEGESIEDEEDRDIEKFKFMYPYGRVIIFSDSGVVFDDKPIDYPFGYPFEIFNPEESDSVWGYSEVDDLTELQDRVNRAYKRLRTLIAKYVSLLVIDPKSGITKKDVINKFVLETEYGQGGSENFHVVTNNTLAEIDVVMNYIKMLKKDALEVSRINEVMMSGERPRGVTSGDMVDSLVESPMATIRDIQGQFRDFVVGVSDKAILLIQKYYNVKRIIRLSGGKQFAEINTSEGEGVGSINIMEMKETAAAGQDGKEIKQRQMETIKQIKSDLSVGQYETMVTAGSELPRNKMQVARLTQELAKEGYLGDQGSIDVKEAVLKNIDYPGWREIIDKLRMSAVEASQNPPSPEDLANLIKDLKMNFKDIPKEAQRQLLSALGIEVTVEDYIAEEAIKKKS